ncbi:DNA-binding HxlR family transcriptional regulator [Enterococcus lemanii]|nr:helix-turn-helix domain-containing protein [Enterococcus lemanii]MBM7709396.1 DNA-binding HxlR family transcriptional regulator [Enterococcus lemanii]
MDKNICPKFETAMSLLGQRWNGLIIYQLLSGTQRFCTIESAVGLSSKVLSTKLKDLEQQNIVQRHVYPETPVRIEYSLTEKGKALEPLMREIEKWSQEWVAEKRLHK